MNTVKYSTNPYNINRMTMAAGLGVLEDEEYTQKNCRTVAENREYTKSELKKLGFEMTDSVTNFIFIRHPEFDGGFLYEELKRRGVLVRHFNKPRLSPYLRVTIGSKEEMDAFLKTLSDIIGGGNR